MSWHRGWIGFTLLAVSVPALAGEMKIYVDELDAELFDRVTYGYDVEAVCTNNGTTVCTKDSDCTSPAVCGVTVNALTPGTQTTIWDLVCAPNGVGVCQTHFWDFSGVTKASFPGIAESASTVVAVDATETCTSTECGLKIAEDLGREDRHFDKSLGGQSFCNTGGASCFIDSDCGGNGPCLRRGLCPNDTTPCTKHTDCTGIGNGRCNALSITLNATEREDNVNVCDNGAFCTSNPQCTGIGDGICKTGSNIWMRAAVRKELEGGGLGQGESRLCYGDDGRPPVPLFRFPHQDADGWYMQLGDAWVGHFNCEQTIFNGQCVDDSSCTFPCNIRADSCSTTNCGASQTIDPRQESRVVNEGQLKLPSGHVFDALVVQQNAEFCAFPFAGCSFAGTPVRTVIYLWEVPELGTLVRVMSVQFACNLQTFTVLAETDIKFGLFPPLAIDVTGFDDTSVDLSWDPGLITDRIGSAAGDYRIYWDTDSGQDSAYVFDSINNAGQASIVGTTATISGLTPGTQYFFTVTAMSDFTDPGTCIFDDCVTTTYESLRFPKQVTGGAVPIPEEVSATTAGGAFAGAVPDGGDRPGIPLRLAKSGAMLGLTWGGSCVAGDTDYEVYRGTLGVYTTHIPVSCNTGGTSLQTAPAVGGSYYLVVPRNAAAEGSYGETSSGSERPVSGSSCLAQSLGSPVCP